MVSIDTIIAMVERPSHRELSSKLKEARAAVERGAIGVINSGALAEDAIELGYLVEELQEVLLEILGEVKPGDYAGSRPPPRSYERETRDLELFAFSWMSRRFGCRVYLKFALKEGTFWLVSLHVDRGRGVRA